MAARGGGSAAAPVVVQRAQVLTGSGDVDRTCPACGGTGDDGDLRHIVWASRTEQRNATLDDGTPVVVNAPVDEAYHLDCHAGLGCEHCAELLEHHDGSVKGRAAEVHEVGAPDHLVELDPAEWAQGERGVLVRVGSGS